MIYVLWWNCGNGFWESEYTYGRSINDLVNRARNHPESYLVVYQDGVVRRAGGLYDHYYVTGEEQLGDPRFLDGEWRYEAPHRTITGVEVLEFLGNIRRE